MFQTKFSRQAEKFLSKCDNELFNRIKNKSNLLEENPFPSDAKFINREDKEKIFRIRVGKHRVLYKIKNKENIILITKIDKREKVYN